MAFLAMLEACGNGFSSLADAPYPLRSVPTLYDSLTRNRQEKPWVEFLMHAIGLRLAWSAQAQ